MSKLDKDWTILEETIAMANGTHEFADEAGGTVCGSDVVWRKLVLSRRKPVEPMPN